jgi:hypothetical protein
LPVFVLTFEYLHEKEILHDSQGLVYISSAPLGSTFIRAHLRYLKEEGEGIKNKMEVT